nr:YchJ family metal-binding protein [Demequina pelophila]
MLCPCGSERPFGECCRPILRGEARAETAEQLMRSRYTANVRRDEGYLLATWHRSTRPARVDLMTEWRGLEVLSTERGRKGDPNGTVTFVAHYATGTVAIGTMRETSRFVFEDGMWLYVDGDVA